MFHSFIILIVLICAVFLLYRPYKKEEFDHCKNNLKDFIEVALIAHIMVFLDKILDKIF